ELPIHGQSRRVPPLGPHRLDLPRFHGGGEGLDAFKERRRTGIEVDPRAPAPHLAPDGDEVDVVGLDVAVRERLWPRHARVRAVLAVAPSVEGTREPARAGPPALDDLDAPVAAGVLEGA